MNLDKKSVLESQSWPTYDACHYANSEARPKSESVDDLAHRSSRDALVPPSRAASARDSALTLPVVLFSLCAGMNSVLLGYDTGVSGGAMFIAREPCQLDLTEVETEIAIGALNVLAVFGVVICRPVSDNWGRTKTLAIAALFFLIGSVVAAASVDFWSLLLGRAIIGLGIGSGLSIDPLYISEITPPRWRGTFVTGCELSINFGIMLGFLSSYVLAYLDPAISWRIMIAVGGLPPMVIIVLALCVMPESPRFLIRKGRIEDAMNVLLRLTGDRDVALATKTDIETQLERDGHAVGWSDLLWHPSPVTKFMLLVVVTIAVLQQACGVEAFMYYTPFLLSSVGLGEAEVATLTPTSSNFTYPRCVDTTLEPGRTRVLGITAAMGAAKSLTLIGAALCLDRTRLGRRVCLCISFMGMAIALAVLATAEALLSPHLLLIGIFTYVILFSVGVGPICWLLASEVLPTPMRTRGMVVAAGMNRLTACIISLSFLSAQSTSSVGAFTLFGAVCLLGCLFTYLRVPETRGIPLEQVPQLFEFHANKIAAAPFKGLFYRVGAHPPVHQEPVAISFTEGERDDVYGLFREEDLQKPITSC